MHALTAPRLFLVQKNCLSKKMERRLLAAGNATAIKVHLNPACVDRDQSPDSYSFSESDEEGVNRCPVPNPSGDWPLLGEQERRQVKRIVQNRTGEQLETLSYLATPPGLPFVHIVLRALLRNRSSRRIDCTVSGGNPTPLPKHSTHRKATPAPLLCTHRSALIDWAVSRPSSAPHKTLRARAK